MNTAADGVLTMATTCKSCDNSVSPDDTFCQQCGYPVQGSEEEQQRFINDRDYKYMELEELNRKVKSASTTLYVLAGLCVVSGVYFYMMDSTENPLAVLIVCIILAAIYAGLAVWSKKKPLAAIISGLVLYIILQVLAAIDSPITLVQGLLIKIAVVVYLIKGLRSASDAQKIQKELNL